MTKKEMIKLYSTILRQWNETMEEKEKQIDGQLTFFDLEE